MYYLLQESCELLTHFEICTNIDEINMQVTEEHESKLRHL
jgi:hypothetical protein